MQLHNNPWEAAPCLISVNTSTLHLPGESIMFQPLLHHRHAQLLATIWKTQRAFKPKSATSIWNTVLQSNYTPVLSATTTGNGCICWVSVQPMPSHTRQPGNSFSEAFSLHFTHVNHGKLLLFYFLCKYFYVIKPAESFLLWITVGTEGTCQNTSMK